ncbi:helix-turn-helix domain-containing protein, partial [Salinispora arenicola]|uniref:helix-turn-helix domain-containing protein n=1 Tax=Salinispora arenicola TaxID=168697 RepID=UPI00169A8E32
MSELQTYRVRMASPEQRGHEAPAPACGSQGERLDAGGVIEEAGLSRSTYLRWEAGRVERPDPEQVRAVCRVLTIDPREAAVALGYLTREEIGLGPEPPRMFDATVEEVVQILQDPAVSEIEKREWVQYLKFRTGRPTESGRRRRAGLSPSNQTELAYTVVAHLPSAVSACCFAARSWTPYKRGVAGSKPAAPTPNHQLAVAEANEAALDQ